MACGEPAWWEDLYKEDLLIDNYSLKEPHRMAHWVKKEYVDNQIKEGQLYLDSTDADKLYSWDKDSKSWEMMFNFPEQQLAYTVQDFEFFTVNLVSDPLLDECKLQLTNESRYDNAMEGI